MLGIDVSKAMLACAYLDPVTQHLAWARSVPNTPAGITRLLARTPPQSPWVLEPTGPYSAPVARQAQAAGRTVLLAPPREAKAFLAARQPRAKTDRLDSIGLAHYALAIRLRPYPVVSPAMDLLTQLRTARTGVADSLSRLRQQRQSLPLAAAALAPAIQALEEQVRALDAQIAAQVRSAALPGVAALDAVPGIGPVTAVAVAACLATRRFAHPDQFVAYIGLDVRVRQSGTRRGEQALSRRGDAELRRLLYLAAQATLRSADPNNPFKQQYLRERAKGLASTAALNAVARKMARLCWSLVTHGTPYDPARVTRQHPATPLDTQP